MAVAALEHAVEHQAAGSRATVAHEPAPAGELTDQGRGALHRRQGGERRNRGREAIELLVGGAEVDRLDLGRDRQREIPELGAGQTQDVIERTRHQANSPSPTKPPSRAPGGTAKTALDVCTMYSLRMSEERLL